MKTALCLTFVLAVLMIPARGDETSTNTTASTEGTNSRPDIKEIFATQTFFTNASGLVIQKITPTLWVSRTEVTQAAYRKVTGGDPSAFPGDNQPVENVSWNGAIEFCKQLTVYEAKEKLLPDGFAYWLPTQSQWESFVDGAGLDSAITSDKTPRQSTAPVASLAANSLNLFDVRGNVWEWTADKNTTYNYRVARGAAWDTSYEVNLRPAFRLYKGPAQAANDIGFRVVLIPAAQATE